MSNNTLKQLALKAKKRLSTVGQTISQKQTTAYLSQTTYAIVANLPALSLSKCKYIFLTFWCWFK